jgi:hypothetical protein
MMTITGNDWLPRKWDKNGLIQFLSSWSTPYCQGIWLQIILGTLTEKKNFKKLLLP